VQNLERESKKEEIWGHTYIKEAQQFNFVERDIVHAIQVSVFTFYYYIQEYSTPPFPPACFATTFFFWKTFALRDFLGQTRTFLPNIL
jgi:hypothetical protein